MTRRADRGLESDSAVRLVGRPAEPEENESFKDTEYARAFGLRIRVARLTFGWSAARLAEAADISVRSVQNLELGQANPSLGTLLRIARSLGKDLSELLPEVPPREQPAPVDSLRREGP